MKRFIIWVCVLFSMMLVGCSDKNSSEKEKETKTLTMAVLQSESTLRSSNLLKWVDLYNETHTDVQIEIVNYLDGDTDLYECLNKIKIEINAGKGPDMINFGRNYSPLDASCGMLVDLYSLIQEDDSFQVQELYYNILEAFEIGDSLYIVVPNYSIGSFATTNEELAELEAVNIQQLTEVYNGLGEDGILFPGETKTAVFGMLCYGSLENYIDWNEGTCSFDSESFRDMLRFANRFPLNLNITEEYSAKSIFAEGKALLYPVTIENPYMVASARMLYGESPAYIGYPFDSGYGSMAEIQDIAIGISATSPNKEEAWTFIKSLLDSEFQDMIQNGLPVRTGSLEKMLEDAMVAEYDANKEKVVKSYLRFEGETPIGIYEISEEDANTLREIIDKIEFSKTIDRDLYNIILEEAEYLFYEERSVEEVADIIQNRVGIYISEKK